MLYSIEGCLMLYTRIPYLQWENFKELRGMILNRTREYFPVLLKRFENTEDLKSLFEPQDWEYLQQSIREQEVIKQRVAYLKGTLVEREKPQISQLADFYPYEALKQGVEWPSNVDPAAREMFLCDEDFFAIFKLTKDQFQKLARFERIRLKKEKRLF